MRICMNKYLKTYIILYDNIDKYLFYFYYTTQSFSENNITIIPSIFINTYNILVVSIKNTHVYIILLKIYIIKVCVFEKIKF